MVPLTLPLHEGLWESTRLRGLASASSSARWADMAQLAGMGALAAVVTTYADFGLRIPGHAILRVVFPMALGLALVPRRGAGSMMGLSALLVAVVLRAVHGPGGGLSLGALTSLTMTGPLLDVSLHVWGRGGGLYLAFALAGLASNLAALLVRGGAKSAGLDHWGARPLAAWLAPATLSYAVCGLLAGLLSACIWFQLRGRAAQREGLEA